jgi:hypothetical protein
VVVTLELEDHVAAGRAAREPDRSLRRLGSGRGVAELLDSGDKLGDQLGDLAGEPVRERDVDTGPLDGLLHRLPHETGVVAEQVDAVATAVVEVFVAVGVAYVRTGGRFDHELWPGTEPRVARLAACDGAADPLERVVGGAQRAGSSA